MEAFREPEVGPVDYTLTGFQAKLVQGVALGSGSSTDPHKSFDLKNPMSSNPVTMEALRESEVTLLMIRL